MNGKLTQKQLKFCLEYLKTGNGTESAIKAGYSKKTAQVIASENLLKPLVKEYLELNRVKIQQKALVTVEELVKDLQKIKEKCMEGLPVFNKDGIEVGKKMDSTGATKSVELLGKHLGMFVEKIEHSGQISTIQIVTSGNCKGLLASE